MTGFDLAVRGRRVLLEGALRPATVLVRDGVVAEIAEPDAAPVAARTIEADLVSPGFLDVHVHFDNPAIDLAEDFHTGTVNAALGGHTFVAEHPFSTPPTTTAARYAAKRDAAQTGAVIDFGLWGAVTGPTLAEIPGQRALGAGGFKAFLPENDMDYPAATEHDLREAFRLTAASGVVLVHAEDRDGLRAGVAAERAAGRTGYAAVLAARPPQLELDAVRGVLTLAEQERGAVHFVHLSVPEAVDLVTAARARGVRATCEVAAHHLLLGDADLLRLGWRALCAPPLRAPDLVAGMWERLARGEIETVVSDHCPYSFADKHPADTDALDGPFGIQGVRESAPLFLTAAVQRGWSLPDALALLTHRPAQRFGLAPAKGLIAVGADADLVLLDETPWTVDAREQFGPDLWSPYDGWTSRFSVAHVLSRGDAVVAAGRFVGRRGAGRFVPMTGGAA